MVYQSFFNSELKQLAADTPWLKGSERRSEFREYEEAAVYDSM